MARPPRVLMSPTISVFTLPVRTISTTRMSSALVTRCPSTNWVG
jgi:hypothetical protein